MADIGRTRKQITDLSEPLQLRELNRQMDWIFAQLYGPLSKKSQERVAKEISDLTERVEALEESNP